MIATISRGWHVAALLGYLIGDHSESGDERHREGVNPHVLASWDGAAERHQPPTTGGGQLDVDELAAELAAPAIAAGIPQREPSTVEAGQRVPHRPVWHCSLRNPRRDRVLSDAEWSDITAELVDRTGIAPRGDLGACRWVAIRNADDHVHVVAVLVRQDNGRQVPARHDLYRAREICRAAEGKLSLESARP